MVIAEVKDKIANVFRSCIVKEGGATGLKVVVEDVLDDCCCVVIPTEFERLGQDFFDGIVAALNDLDEVVGIYDSGKNWNLGKNELRRIEINTKDGCWVESDEDRQKGMEMDRMCSDPKYARECEEKRRLEMLSHWEDYILPIPGAPKHWSDELYLTMAYEPYDWIKNGEKTTEFRAYTPSYVKRLLSHPLKTVKFQRGYGGPGRPFPEQMVWEIKKIELYDIRTRISADPFNPTPILPTHFAIDLGRRLR